MGRERHADGGYHLHAFVWFRESKFSTRVHTCFDIEGTNHPNITRVGRTPRKVFKYTVKDKDILIQEVSEEDLPGPREGGRDNRDNWGWIQDALSKDEFFDRLRESNPRALICSYPSIAKYADWRYREIPEPYNHPENITFDLGRYPLLEEWRDENLGPRIQGLHGGKYHSPSSTCLAAGRRVFPGSGYRPQPSRPSGLTITRDRQAKIPHSLGDYQNGQNHMVPLSRQPSILLRLIQLQRGLKRCKRRVRSIRRHTRWHKVLPLFQKLARLPTVISDKRAIQGS